ncbi:uncharacterized protein [Typha latifolia]|uniref:uncharacterized protein n=1 Tax=Typha latifolia TaxID=4733 RepID=UPI003C2CD75E
MDWYSWLSKSTLEPSLVYEYSFMFTQNELEEEDIVHFDHEFLKSMGISIAKHRLEILKLAKKERRVPSDSMGKLVTAMRRTKKCLSTYIHKFVHHKRSAIIVMPRASYGGDWRRGGGGGGMLKRSKKLMLLQQGRLMITDGGVKVAMSSMSQSASPMVRNCYQIGEGDDEEEYWGSEADDSKWHSMFQNMKPT